MEYDSGILASIVETSEEHGMDGTSKARENKLRRRAARLGMKIRKDRKRLWGLHNQGGYMLVDLYMNACIQGADFDLDLDEVEKHLDWYAADMKAGAAAR